MALARSILKHSAIYSGANALGKLVGFILLPFYAHIFDTEGYGVIGMVDGSIGLLSILFGAASHNAVMRVFHGKRESPEQRRLVISTSLWLIWATSALLILLPLAFSRPLSELLLDSPDYQSALVVASLTFLVGMGSNAAANFLIIEQRSVTYSLIGLFRLVMGISLNIYLVLILKIGVIGIFLSSFFTAVASGAILHWVAIRACGLKFDRGIGRELLAIWVPLMPGELFDYAGRQAERFFVRFLVSLDGVGVLEMAYKFPPLLGYFISQPFLLAWRTKSFEIAAQPDAPAVMGKMFTNMLFLMAAAGLLLAVTIDEILMLLTPESFWFASRIARIEVVTTIIAAANSYFLFGLYQEKQAVKISIIKSSMAAVKFVLSGGMIWFAGLNGAAFSALVVQGLTLVWIYTASQRYYRVELEYGRVIGILAIAAFMAVAIDQSLFVNSIIDDELVSTAIASVATLLDLGEPIVSVLDNKAPILGDLIAQGVLGSLFFTGIFLIRPSLGRALLRRS